MPVLAGKMAWDSSSALHMVSFEIFVKAMLPSLSELKILPSFCFAFKIPDNRAVTRLLKYLITNQMPIISDAFSVF